VQAADTLPGKAFEAIDRGVDKAGEAAVRGLKYIDKATTEVGGTTVGKAAVMLALLVGLFGGPQEDIQQDPEKYLGAALKPTQQVEKVQAPEQESRLGKGQRIKIIKGAYAGYPGRILSVDGNGWYTVLLGDDQVGGKTQRLHDDDLSDI
jgi:hypothetical protein